MPSPGPKVSLAIVRVRDCSGPTLYVPVWAFRIRRMAACPPSLTGHVDLGPIADAAVEASVTFVAAELAVDGIAGAMAEDVTEPGTSRDHRAHEACAAFVAASGGLQATALRLLECLRPDSGAERILSLARERKRASIERSATTEPLSR